MTKAIESARAYWLDNRLSEYEFVLLLPYKNDAVRSAFLNRLGSKKGIVIEEAEARTLMALYSLYEFTGNLIIGSFDEPYGRKLGNLLSCGIASEVELINDVILGSM